jgi:hypothetical protein
MSASSVRKGKDFEQRVARSIREVLGVDARRGQQARKGTDAPDVIGLPSPWWTECKYGARANLGVVLEEGWEQASRPNAKPVLFFQAPRRPLRVVVAANDLLGLMRENAELRRDLATMRAAEALRDTITAMREERK